MKKFTYVLFIILCGAMLFACDSKKKDNGSSVKNTPIVEGNFSTYLGNYKVVSIEGPSLTPPFSTNDPKQALDLEGFLSINMASASGVDVRGAFQVGGNMFIDTEVGGNNVPAVDSFKSFSTIGASVSAIDAANQIITFQNISPVDGSTFVISMKKVDDTVFTVAESEKKLVDIWSETGVCFRDRANGIYQNCVNGTPNGEGTLVVNADNTLTYTPAITAISSAVKLIGNYYIEKIDIVNNGSGVGCPASISVANDNPDSLVGELGAKAEVGSSSVTLGIALKFQTTPIADCNLFNKDGYFFLEFNDLISLSGTLDLDKIFKDEGLTDIGTETIEYTPQVKMDGCTPSATNSCYTDRLIQGSEVKITLKKARNGFASAPYSKILTDARYY